MQVKVLITLIEVQAREFRLGKEGHFIPLIVLN